MGQAAGLCVPGSSGSYVCAGPGSVSGLGSIMCSRMTSKYSYTAVGSRRPNHNSCNNYSDGSSKNSTRSCDCEYDEIRRAVDVIIASTITLGSIADLRLLYATNFDAVTSDRIIFGVMYFICAFSLYLTCTCGINVG
jgi:hypothetical protein